MEQLIEEQVIDNEKVKNKNQGILFLHKYQPLYFKDFEQNSSNSIVNMLNIFIQMDSLNILFIGDIGSGKTTYLNALIKEYYKDTEYSSYKDNILYINSLKEQGIGYFRNEFKIFCQTSSSVKNKKKMVIMDDIDIVTEQSQQVCRNCIDKYSNNVHFIASCSNPQKVIETLQSRFTILQITKLQKFNLEKIMDKIMHCENLRLNAEAKNFILNISNNNPKMLINYLEKIKIYDSPLHVDIILAKNICKHVSFLAFDEYTLFLINGDLANAVKLFYSLYDKGYSVMDILINYFTYIKVTECLTESQKYDIIPFICKYITIFYNIHEDEIELALFSNSLYKIFYPFV